MPSMARPQKGREMDTNRVEQGRGREPDALLTVEDVLGQLKTSRSGFAIIRRTTDFPPPVRLTPGSRRLLFPASSVRAWLSTRQRA